MSKPAKVFVTAIIGIGAASLAFGIRNNIGSHAGFYLVALLVTMAASAFKVVLPHLKANLSLNYVCLIWGILRLGMAEAMFLGIASTFVQCYWRAKQRPKAVQIAFNASVICIAILIAKTVLFWEPLIRLVPSEQLRIMAIAIVYYAVNTSIVSVIVALTEGQPAFAVWKSSYLWALPHYLFGASLVAAAEWTRRVLGAEAMVLVLPAAYLIYHTFTLQMDNLMKAVERAELEKSHAQQTADLHLRTIRALALAIEAKDETTGEHLHRVQTYALGLGKAFGLPPEEMEALHAAAILHDIGKIAVPEYIISKPAKLSREEFAQMKIHPIVGAEIVESVRFPFGVAPLVRAHHEKWDGSGYPDGLKGEEIPLGARILTAVDYLDALASDRQYRKAMPLDKAMEMIVGESGKALDPKVVDALLTRYVDLEALAKNTLHEAATGIKTQITVERGHAPDAGYAVGIEAGSKVRQPPSSRVAHEIAVIQQTGVLWSEPGELEDCLRHLLAKLSTLMPIESAALYVCRDSHLECLFAEGESASTLRGLRIPLGVGISGWVAQVGRPLVNGNAQTELPAGQTTEGFPLQSGLAVALSSELGTLGVLTIYSTVRDAFTLDHLRLLLATSSGLAYRLWLHAAGLTIQPEGAIEPAKLAAQLTKLAISLDGAAAKGLAPGTAAPDDPRLEERPNRS